MRLFLLQTSDDVIGLAIRHDSGLFDLGFAETLGNGATSANSLNRREAADWVLSAIDNYVHRLPDCDCPERLDDYGSVNLLAFAAIDYLANK